MSTEYHKINAPFKRHTTGPDKGKLILEDWALPELEYLEFNKWDFTEKVDGTNIRIDMMYATYTLYVEYGGRTDNAKIPEPLLQKLEALFPTYPQHRRDLGLPSWGSRYSELKDWFEAKNLEGVPVTLYGEGYGPKIQGGGKYRNDPSFVLFDVKINNWWLSREGVQDVADNLGIDCVPSLGTGTLWDAIYMVEDGLTSSWGDFLAEGIVARPVVDLYDRRGNRIITKIKTKDFFKA